MKLIHCEEDKVLILRMSAEEAYEQMQSISSQLVSQNPNVGRKERFIEFKKKQNDFSIVVEPINNSDLIKNAKREGYMEAVHSGAEGCKCREFCNCKN
jgi:hypothetical protein